MAFTKVRQRLRKSPLFKDSFWAVFGNALGYGLLMLAGILIARLLGSDLYGEYGVVKSTMFYIASFATLGLGVTSTKYVAEYLNGREEYVKCLIRDSRIITLITSGAFAVVLLSFSQPLADFLDEPQLSTPFRYLGAIIIFRALNTTQTGILGGLKMYRQNARNSFLSGVFMIAACVPFTYYFSLDGALASLILSQIFNWTINSFTIRKKTRKLCNQKEKSFIGELFRFSFPVALQESSYFVCAWGGMMILTKFSTLSDVGIYSAASQWNAIILFIPSTLYNVVLSHLSTHSNDFRSQLRIVKLMLLTNFIATLFPFLIVWVCSDWIQSFYGESYQGMARVMNILVFATIFTCCSNVLRSEFVALGKNWQLLIIRAFKDCFFLGLVYYLTTSHNGSDGAFYYACADLSTAILHISLLTAGYFYLYKTVIIRKLKSGGG